MLTLQNYVGNVQRNLCRSSLSSALLQMANLQIRAKLGLFFVRDSARWADSATESWNPQNFLSTPHGDWIARVMPGWLRLLPTRRTRGTAAPVWPAVGIRRFT